MAQKTIRSFELPVVAISLTTWVISCNNPDQLAVARAYSENILDTHFGIEAKNTLTKLMELCDNRAEYLLKYKEHEMNSVKY
jgi:hypothetical protein